MIEAHLRDGFGYLATPYTKYNHGIEEANRAACYIAADLLREGIKVFSPIAHSHAIAVLGHLDATDAGIWMPLNLEILPHVDFLIVVEMFGWQYSKGVKEEMDFAIDHDIPIYYYCPITKSFSEDPN